MKLFNRRPICNNNSNSAPVLNGRPFFLCWRCCGAICGLFFSAIVSIFFRFPFDNYVVLFLLIIPAVLDYSLNRLNLKKENNKLRFITGILLGISIGYVESMILL